MTVASAAGATPNATPRTALHTTTKTITFTGNYSGKLTLLINGSTITAQKVTGTGTATDLGKSTLSGTGKSSTSAQCDPMSGTGALVGSGSKLNVTILTHSQGCAAGYTAPTKVTVTGTVKVTSGAGKFKGATGTLSFSGSFTLKSSTAGGTDAFTAKLTGKLKVA
jgi:hypothetical protein